MSENQNKQTPPRPNRSKGSCLFYAFILTGISFLVDQANLFGFSTLISNQNERIYQRLTAGSYGDKSRIGQSRLVVMLYTDNATRLPGMGWPMKYDALAEQINDLDMTEARGIFVDMVFRGSGRDKEAFCRLVKTMGEVSDSPLPPKFDGANCLEMVPRYQQVLMNKTIQSGNSWPLHLKGDTTAFPESKKLSSPKKLLLIGASLDYLNARSELRECKGATSCKRASNRFIEAMNAWPATFVMDHVAQLVPLNIGAVDGKAIHLSVDKAGHISSVLRVAHHLRLNPANQSSTLEINLKESTMEDVLYLHWGNKVDTKQIYAKPLQQFGGCPGIEGGFLTYLRTLALQVFPQSSDDRNLTARCPYHLTIDMADYHNNVEIPPSVDSEFQRFGFKMLAELVENRFVLIGMSMNRLADTVESPVHGKIAGIYAHAMAIDNLLEYSNGFSRAYQPEPDAVFQSDSWLLLWQYALTCILAAVFLRYGANVRDYFIRGPLSMYWNLTGLIIILIFVGGLLIGMRSRLDMGGSNWLDSLLTAVLTIGVVYTVFIFFGPWLMDRFETKGGDTLMGVITTGISERNTGTKKFLPLMAFLLFVWLGLLLAGVFVGYLSNGNPFNFLFVFLSLMTLFVLALNNELFGGLATFIAGKSIADEFY